MKNIECTFSEPNKICPNCGGASTSANYYTAIPETTHYKPRRKSSGYKITRYKNVTHHCGSFCSECSRVKCKRNIINDSVAAVICAALAVGFYLLISLINPTNESSNWLILLFLLLLLLAIVLTISFFNFFVMIFVWLSMRVQLRKDIGKFDENRKSIMYERLTRPHKEGRKMYPITKYDFLMREHRS